MTRAAVLCAHDGHSTKAIMVRRQRAFSLTIPKAVAKRAARNFLRRA
jgi:hypothetical protein